MVNRNKKLVSNKNNNNNKSVDVGKKVVGKSKDFKQKLPVKSIAVKEVPEDNSSDDDISEEEMKKMLGTSDNSDIDSEEFSEEENVKIVESKVNRKRKLSSDDEDNLKKAKKDEDEDEEDDEDDEDEDEDDIDMDDSFIDDGSDDVESGEEEEEEDNKDSSVKIEQSADIKKEKKKIDLEEIHKIKKATQEMQAKRMAPVKEMFLDTPKIENDKLKKEIQTRLQMRKERTVVITNIPRHFTSTHAKLLVPNLISCVLPYNSFLHKIVGTLYVDMKTPEEAVEVAKRINKTKQTVDKLNIGPLGAIVQTKMIDDVEKYNCSRLVISNIQCKAEKEDLTKIMPKATRIEVMPVKAIDRKSFKTGFAEYSNVGDAIKDYDAVHGTLVRGHPINLKFQIKKSDNVKNKQCNFDKTRLRILGLKKNTRAEEIKQLFPQAIGITLTLERGSATVVYNNEEECEIDRKNAIANKPNKKWKITSVMGKTTVKGEVEMVDSKPIVENIEFKKIEGKKFEQKKVEGKKFEQKKVEGKKLEQKKVEGKKFEPKKFGKKNENVPTEKIEGKKFEKKNSDGKRDSSILSKDDKQKPNISKVLIHPRHDVQGPPQLNLERASLKKKKKTQRNEEVSIERKGDNTKRESPGEVPELSTNDGKGDLNRVKRRRIRKEKRKSKHQKLVTKRHLKLEQLKVQPSNMKVVKAA